MVVIGIIAILIAFLLPVLNRVRESAKTLKCAAQLRQIGQAIFSYAAANRGLMPPHSDGHSYPDDFNPDDPNGPGWIPLLTPHIGVKPDSPIYTCPAFPGDGHPITYYLSCRWMQLQTPPVHTFPMSQIKLSSQYILSGDVTGPHWDPIPFGTSNLDFDNIDKDDANADPAERCLIFFGEPGGFNMHRAGNNVLFSDGHVQAFRKFDRRYMTYSPHLVQDWLELTAE
jgi:prepilin-type processing-associated H-X9-DG protein